MMSLKDETLSIRTSFEIKQLIRLAAKKEHRSIASMIEVLILDYAQQHGLKEIGSSSAEETMIEKANNNGTN